MKKIITSLFLLLLSVFICFSEEIYALIDLNHAFLNKAERKIGNIILADIKDSRKEKQGQGDITFLGNVRVKNYGIATPFRSKLPIDYSLTNLFDEALSYAGFDIAGTTPDRKTPVLNVELLSCYFDGMMVYGLNMKYKITLTSADGQKTLYSKTLSATTACFLLGPPSIEAAYNRVLNTILKKTALTFSDASFIEAYHGRAYNADFEVADYTDKELESIPSDVANPQNIRYLILRNNDIKKIENLEKLNNLEELDLSMNDIKKIENLDNNKKLKFISFSSNKLASIENLDNLTELQELDLNNMDIKKIEGLDNLKKLQWLILSNNDIKKIEGIDNLKELLWLNLQNTDVKKIEGLDDLKKLIWLNFNATDIKKIENLNSLTSLIYLDFNYCLSLKKIESLDKLTNLQYLNLSNTDIKKLEGLDDLVNLRKLKIDNSPIEKIEGINNLINLEELYITRYFLPGTISISKTIKKIENIDNLVNLKVLDISGTDVSVIENVEKLTDLRILNISGTKIKTLANINSLTNLQKLDISYSKIKKLENIEDMKYLTWINYTPNQIKEISEATYNSLKSKNVQLEGMDMETWVKKRRIKIK